ncbi:hypothetical protein Pint_14411 [Pistacia integerrima]|uniref:Uncharacterized protein n=1 Tax=Pistacia integerrima TaxID=434235 RepID=A0ACC0Y945_9ROSI|nr:hypothetical protein Pint_14411 [Pistacia integerrima]
MEIKVKETSVVGPLKKRPSMVYGSLNWISGHTRAHIPLVYFYVGSRHRRDRSYFFGSCVLKEALSKALVAFYPLGWEFEDEALVPTIDYSTSDISFYPLLTLHVPPFIDRTILHARIPPHPTFNHIEYHPPPSMDILESQSSPRPTSMARFRLPLDQINAFKAKLKNEHGATYSTFVILAAHIWRCVCKARGLPGNQSTKLYIPTEGRSRLNPPLPLGYLGNVIFTATPIALACDIQSKPLIYSVKIIHEALKKMNDEYLRSTLAYAEQHYNNMMTLEQGVPNSNCPNLRIVSWARMPIYDTDFGWGSPIFMGRATIPSEGASFILSSPSNERGLSLIICLETPHMELFKKLLYTEGVALMKNYYKPSSL